MQNTATKTVTGSDFIAHLKGIGFTSNQARLAAQTLFAGISASLESGSNVSIKGLGRFSLVNRKARSYTVPHTGTPNATNVKVNVAAHRAVYFRPADSLRDELRSQPML